MHLRALGVTFCVAVAGRLLAGCSTSTSAPPSTTAGGRPEATSAYRDNLCTNRSNCAVERVQSVDGVPEARFVRVVITPQSIGDDDDDCERREYWLVNGPRNTLLATDCVNQLGADSQGPAEVTLTGSHLSVRYVEFQEEDRCELVDATIDLVAVMIERQERREGSVARDTCVPEGPHSITPPTGDGSPAKPLLVLHRG
jgi:hypothetical protein